MDDVTDETEDIRELLQAVACGDERALEALWDRLSNDEGSIDTVHLETIPLLVEQLRYPGHPLEADILQLRRSGGSGPRQRQGSEPIPSIGPAELWGRSAATSVWTRAAW